MCTSRIAPTRWRTSWNMEILKQGRFTHTTWELERTFVDEITKVVSVEPRFEYTGSGRGWTRYVP